MKAAELAERTAIEAFLEWCAVRRPPIRLCELHVGEAHGPPNSSVEGWFPLGPACQAVTTDEELLDEYQNKKPKGKLAKQGSRP